MQPYVQTLKELADWAPYLPSGFEAVKYPDSQSLFTLGKAAIYPAGSWEISQFNKDAKFPMGVFLPPVDKAGDECYISDHTDIALGMNAKGQESRSGQEVPGLGCLAGICRDLQQCAARVLLAARTRKSP